MLWVSRDIFDHVRPSRLVSWQTGRVVDNEAEVLTALQNAITVRPGFSTGAPTAVRVGQGNWEKGGGGGGGSRVCSCTILPSLDLSRWLDVGDNPMSAAEPVQPHRPVFGGQPSMTTLVCSSGLTQATQPLCVS